MYFTLMHWIIRIPSNSGHKMCADTEAKAVVLAVVQFIKTDAARCRVFALQINSPFTFTVTRHFQTSNKKFRMNNYFSISFLKN